jgi:rod shape-determining protein MreC
VLQIIALSFLVRYNKFHEAAFMGVANELTGRVNSKYSNVEYYFHLKKTNESLALENERLLNALKSNFQSPDSSQRAIIDTVKTDSASSLRRYLYMSARVVNNSVSLQNNSITIHRGSSQGVKKDMGVVSANGIVGVVVNTSDNFSVVMTMLNRQSGVSVKLLKSGEVGKVQWDGEDPNRVTLINIPKSAKVNKGDSVITSGYSLSFPPNIMVGTIAEVVDDKSSNFYTLMIKPSTNFYNVEYVNVVENLQRDEQKKLEESVKKNQ